MDPECLIIPTVRCDSTPVLLEQVNELKIRVSELEKKLHDSELHLRESENEKRELRSKNICLEVENRSTSRTIEREIDDVMKTLLSEEVSMKRLQLLLSTQSCFLIRKEFSQLCRMLENLDYDEIQSLQENITNEPVNHHETEQLMNNIGVFSRMHRRGQIDNINNLHNLDTYSNQ